MMMKKKKYMAYVLMFTVLFTNFFPAQLLAAANDAPQFMSPHEIMNHLPGQQQRNPTPQAPNPLQQAFPNLPQGMQGGMPNSPLIDSPQMNGQRLPDSQDGMQHPVNIVTGQLSLKETDLNLPGVGFGFQLDRVYDPNRESVGAFGLGWDYNWNSLLRMYAEYEMGEFRVDQTVNTYSFVTEDPNAYILEYDGDDKVNYELHKGYYESSNGDTLARINQEEYVVRNSMGGKYTYSGYYAPWRSTQSVQAGKMIQQQDRFGNTMHFSYDDAGQLVQITDTADREILLTWDNGVITLVTDPIGGEYTYTYDELQRLTEVSSPAGRTYSYRYDDQNRVTQLINGEGNETNISYNANNQVVTVDQNEEEQQLIFTYELTQTTLTNVLDDRWVYEIEDEHLVSSTNPLGEITQYVYNENDLLTQLITPQGTETTEYDDTGKYPVTKTAINGAVTTYVNHPIWNQPTLITHPDGSTTSFQYDEFGNIKEKVNPAGEKAVFGYNAKGQLVWMENELEARVRFIYDEQGNITKEINPLGYETVYTYDGLGQLTSKGLPDGSVFEMHYDPDGKLFKTEDGLGAVTEYYYDGNGELVEIIDALGHTTLYSRDQQGRVIQYTDALQQKTTYEYDELGRISGVINPLNQKTSFERDALGRIIQMQKSNDAVTSYGYGDFGVERITDSRGTLTYEYDLTGQISKVQDSDGRTTFLEYDLMGRLEQVTDPVGRTQSFTYDPLGRKLTETRPDGSIVKHKYNEIGLLDETILPNNSSIQYKYNGAKQLTQTIYPDGSNTQTTYTKTGQPFIIKNPVGHTINYYDANQRVNKVIGTEGDKTLLEYNALGWLIKVTDPLHAVTSYAYDALGRVISVTDALGGKSEFDYDELGRLLSMTDPEGRVQKWSYNEEENKTVYTNPEGKSFSYIFDEKNQLTQIINPLLHETQMEYNSMGLRSKITNAEGHEIRFVYDEAGQLLQRFDAKGEATTYEYNLLGQPESVTNALGQKTSLSYDVMGNVTKLMNHRGEFSEFTYDSMGRKTSMIDPLGNITSWEYNSLGQISKGKSVV